MGLDIFENEGISEKGCVEIEDWGFSVHFGWSSKKVLFTLYTYVLAKILQNVVNLGIQKLVSKITGIWTTSDKQWKVQKVEIWWAFVQKNTFLQLKYYIQWIYLTLLSTTCV